MPKESEQKEESFVEVEGVKYKEDPDNPGEALKDDDDKLIPFEEKDEEKDDDEDEDDEDEEEDDDDDDSDDDDDDEEEEFQMPDKFKGKSAEEIAKSYNELEKMIDKKATEKAEEILKKKKEGKDDEDEEEDEEEEIKPPMKDGKPDFSQFTPDKFADWVVQEIEKRAEAKAKKIFDEGSRVKESVTAEIKGAQKNHPLLKTNEEYRELVLAIVESAATKGKTVSLEEACKKVDTLVGKKEGTIEEKEKAKLKKAKAVVEKSGGSGGSGKEDTDEEKIKKSLLGGSKSSLGGLGI